MPIVNHKSILHPLGAAKDESKILRQGRNPLSSGGANRKFKACICLLIVAVWCLVVASSCPSEGHRGSQPRDRRSSIVVAEKEKTVDEVSVFLTGSELGALKPCGCSGGQLGGLDRRSVVFAGAPKQKRLIIDTGGLVKSDSEQDLIKFSIIIQSFSLLDYDLVNLTEKDMKIAQNLGLLSNPIVGFISPYGSGEKIAGRFRNQYLLNSKYVAISVLTFDVDTAPIEQIREVFSREPGQRSVNILIINRCDDAIIFSIAKLGTVDCLVCPSESDEPTVISDPNKRPLVFSVGRFGRYVSRLQITEGGEKDKLKINFSAIPVTEDLPQEKSLVELYKAYQQLVKDSNLLEKLGRFALPNGLKYTGSESCKLCHRLEYETCSDHAHAHAFSTLQRVGSQFDPECVVCHTVGMKYESGYVSEEKTAYLKNVGCENCHGPGSEHIRTLGEAKTTEPKSQCLDCHTPEQSSRYAGNEQLYREKIIHWWELTVSGDVKKEGSRKD